jgi:hypothetical protein
VSLPELIIHELGHTFFLHHPAVNGPQDKDAVVSSIMTPTEPFGGGIHNFDDPFYVDPVGEAGRLLPADFQHQREHSPSFATSRGTLYITNELTRIAGGLRCSHPAYPDSHPACTGTLGVDFFVTVERDQSCPITGTLPNGDPCDPIVPVFYTNVNIDYKEIWVGDERELALPGRRNHALPWP